MSDTDKSTGQRLAELRRSGASGTHESRPRGQRTRKDIKAKAIRDSHNDE